MKRGRNQRRRQGVNVNRALDSNGPDVRIRGTANQIYDKYQNLARDAASAGDRIKAESYLQHAEHYFRLIKSAQAQSGGQAGANAGQQNNQGNHNGNQNASENGEQDNDASQSQNAQGGQGSHKDTNNRDTNKNSSRDEEKGNSRNRRSRPRQSSSNRSKKEASAESDISDNADAPVSDEGEVVSSVAGDNSVSDEAAVETQAVKTEKPKPARKPRRKKVVAEEAV